MSTEGPLCGRQTVVSAPNVHDPMHHQQVKTTVENPLPTNFSCIMPPKFSPITQPQMVTGDDKENRPPTTLKSCYNFPLPPEPAMNQQGLPLGFLETSAAFSLIGAPPLYFAPSGMPFRYHLRRPVESWKYTENKKEDGSLVYMCRFCSAVYKHKKSLNKHWKDKHSGELGPNGEAGNEDEEEEEEGEASADVENSPPPEHSFEASEPAARSCLASTPVANTLPIKLTAVSPITLASTTVNTTTVVQTHSPSSSSSQRTQRFSLPFTRPTRSPHMRASLRRLPPPAPSVKRPIMPCSPPSAATTSTTTVSSTAKREEGVGGNFLPIASKRRNSEMPSQPQAVPCTEYSPLDLSLSKTDAAQTAVEAEPAGTPTQAAAGPLKDRHLLSLLLQTALSALAGEPESVRTVDDLSVNTLNLLRSVGGILVSSTTSLEEKPKTDLHEGEETKHKPPPDRRTEPFAEVPPRPNTPPTPLTAQNLGIQQSQGLSLSAYVQQSLQPVSKESDEHMNTAITQPPFQFVEMLPQLLPGEHQQSHPQDHRHPHQQQQTGDAVIPCPVCTFVGRWFSELRAHMVNHSEHRMFGCCYCSYRAKWKWDVAKHMRRCPLSRHVAHLQNECLLRMVCYFPPPQGDILFAYFPQYGFPGVGIDKPISPPPQPSSSTGSSPVDPTISVAAAAGIQMSTMEVTQVRETTLPDQDQNLSSLPPSDVPATEVKSKVSVVLEDDEEEEEEEEEKPLCIDDLGGPVDEDGQEPVCVSDAVKLDSQSQYSAVLPTTNQLNAKMLKRCAVCKFQSSSTTEFEEHVGKLQCANHLMGSQTVNN